VAQKNGNVAKLQDNVVVQVAIFDFDGLRFPRDRKG